MPVGDIDVHYFTVLYTCSCECLMYYNISFFIYSVKNSNEKLKNSWRWKTIIRPFSEFLNLIKKQGLKIDNRIAVHEKDYFPWAFSSLWPRLRLRLRSIPMERVDWLLLSQWSALIGCCAAHARICTCACVLVVGDSVDWNTGTRCVHGNQPKCQHYYCHVFNVYFLFYFFVNIIFFSFYILGLGFISIGVICHFLSGLSPLLAYYMGCEIFRKRDLKDFKRSKVQQVL